MNERDHSDLGRSLAEKIARLCALIIDMDDEAAPAHPYASCVAVDPDTLMKAAELAYEVRIEVSAKALGQELIVWPHRAAEVLGQEGTREVVDLMNQPMAFVSATKVDNSEYVIKAQFEGMRADMKAQIRGALLTGLAWTTLIGGLFGALYAFMK